MPTYTYECEKCEEGFEIVQKMSDDAIEDCPICKETKSIKKIINPAGGFRLKGRGWFKNGGY